jgi:transcriptional regulator with XRE-family HTH domain
MLSIAISIWEWSNSMEDQAMIVGERLRALREEKKLSQGVVEDRTGLLRCYISRVENGHTVPAVETLEKFARALEVPMYQLFYEGEKPPKLTGIPKGKTANEWGSKGKDAQMLAEFCRLFGRMEKEDLRMVLFMAQKMARGKGAVSTK